MRDTGLLRVIPQQVPNAILRAEDTIATIEASQAEIERSQRSNEQARP
jgi:hypothetical protein